MPSVGRFDEVIRRALRDAEAAYAARGIRLDLDLQSRASLSTEEGVLVESVYALFRALPARLARGATLRVTTRDRAGGDIELAWQATEVAPSLAREQASSGQPYGDLVALALEGLERFCRARSGHVEMDEAPQPGGATSVERRYFFLIPSLQRDPRWHPRH